MQTIQLIPCERGYTHGTSLQGNIEASYSDLVRMFGEPAFEGIGDKITTEWIIEYQVSDGEGERKYGTFTLYDWHFSRNLHDKYVKTTWNVGGTSYDDSSAADIAVKLFNQLDEKIDFMEDAILAQATLHELPIEEEFVL